MFNESNQKDLRKTTQEGYNIYKEDELNIGKGGDTKDCPFDCNCCFW